MRTRSFLLSGLVIVLCLGFLPGASAGFGVVGVANNFFNPDPVNGTVGGDLEWDWLTTRQHNVRQNKMLFYSGAPVGDSDFSFARTFSAGTFPYYCEVHGSPGSGMDGVVKVKPGVSEEPGGLPFTVTWATGSSNTGAAFDVQYRIGAGDWVDWKTDTTEQSAVFGDGDDPVAVTEGQVYRFRARSQRTVSSVGKVSKFSPKVSFTPVSAG